MSLLLNPPFWSVKILFMLIYYFTIFLSGDGFCFLFDPHNQMINVHVISLSYIISPKNVALAVSQFKIRHWDLLLCRWFYTLKLLWLC